MNKVLVVAKANEANHMNTNIDHLSIPLANHIMSTTSLSNPFQSSKLG